MKKRRTLQRIPKEKYFELATGERLRHYVSLAHALDSMSHDVFSHHVRGNQNDFALWIRDVFGEEELAKQVAESDSPKDMQVKIYQTVIKRHV